MSMSVFLCIDCAGIHRRLGTAVSRVKSVKLDRWTVDEVEVISTEYSDSSQQCRVVVNYICFIIITLL